MMRVSRRLRKWTAAIFDLPQDVVLDLPRITMIGGLQLTVENHRGVIHFSPQLLQLAMDDGIVEIKGQNLIIRNIGSEEVYVEGEIQGVQFLAEGKSSS